MKSLPPVRAIWIHSEHGLDASQVMAVVCGAPSSQLTFCVPTPTLKVPVMEVSDGAFFVNGPRTLCEAALKGAERHLPVLDGIRSAALAMVTPPAHCRMATMPLIGSAGLAWVTVTDTVWPLLR